MKKILVVETIMLMALASCVGSGSSSSGGSTGSSIIGQFIDSPVKGLDISRTVSGRGKTLAKGKFSCVADEVITFSLRGLEIGSSVCGKKIYLDDVANPLVADIIASIIQSLSTTAANSGLIDLSAIPDGQDMTAIKAIVGSGDDSTLAAAIAEITAEVEASGVTIVPYVDPLAARAHANSQLPAPDNALATALLSHSANSSLYVKATKTSGNDDCWGYYTAKIEVTKNIISGDKTVYFAKIGNDSVLGYDENPTAICTTDCNQDGLGLDGYDKLIKDGSTQFTGKEEDTFSISTALPDQTEQCHTNGSTCPIGSIKVSYKDLLGNMGLPDNVGTEYFQFDNGSSLVTVENIKGYFPFTATGGADVKLNFSADGSISGTVKDSFINLYMSNYVSPTNYTITKELGSCTYSLAKFDP